MWRRSPPFVSVAPFALILVSAGAAQAAAPSDLYYERTLMARAGERCPLFDPAIPPALTASARQARGAALRGGTAAADLDAAAGRARARADATPCDSPDLRRVATRVQAGFAGWASMMSMKFPGERTSWSAQRAYKPPAPVWMLSTPLNVAGAPAVLGLTSQDGGASLTLVLTPSLDDAYTVRLVLRDPAKAPDPYLAQGGAPPPGASLAILAAAREPAPPSLRPAKTDRAALVRFPPLAAHALAQLDPRENARLEWVYTTRTGERVVSVMLSAGDFAAGRAFLAVGR